MNIKAKCLVPFKDGNIFPEPIKVGQIINVPEFKFNQIIASGGMFEVIARTVPPSTKATEDAPTKG